jgi:hypothetical protein
MRRDQRDRRVMLLAAVPLAAAAVVPLRLLTSTDGDASPSPVPVRPVGDVTETTSAGSTVVSAGPTGEQWGVPSGYQQSPAGVRAAAVGWVASFGSLLQMGPIALSDSVYELMSERAGAETLGAFKQERQRFIDSFGIDPLEGLWLDAPLTVDLIDYSPDRATVEVWSQLLMGSPLADVSVVYRTQTVTLLWERGDWRVDDVTRQPGPTPTMVDGELPSPGAEFTDPIGEWLPAVAAGTATEDDG